MAPNLDDLSHSNVRAGLRVYLDRWEAWEEKNRREASIPNIEWNALKVLATRKFEHVDEDNYVGKLLEKAPCIGPITKLADEEFMDETTKTRSFRTSFRLPGNRGDFPREGYGFRSGEEPPSFPQKKRAKQFAAKCALAFLDDHPDWSDSSEQTLSNLRSAPSAMSSSPGLEKPKVRDPEDQQGAPIISPTLSTTTTTTTTSSNQTTLTSPSQTLSAKEEPAPNKGIIKLVEILANNLGFGLPAYLLETRPGGVFSCTPIFQSDGRIPKDLGAVTDAASEAQAKSQAAEKLLSWLVQKQGVYRADADELLEDIANS